jgi:penicillin amidase
MEIREERISVKKGEDHLKKLKFTHRGPIISSFRGVDDVELSMRWSGYDLSNEISAVYNLNRAENWTQFKEAIKGFNSVSQNIIYADTEGNIGLHVAGGIAIRKGYGTMIRPGDTDEYDWKGYLTQEELPFIYNPESGEVSSANNKTVDDTYPYYIGAYYSVPYRINRVRQMLGEKEILNIDDFKEMITDRHSDYAMKLVPFLINAMEGNESIGATEKELLARMAEWDYNMAPDLVAPTVFEYFKKNLASRLLKDDIGDLYSVIYGTVRDHYLYRLMTEDRTLFVDDITTPEIETLQDIIAQAFSETVDEMVSKYGDISGMVWGDIHQFSAIHPLGTVSMLDKLFNLNSDYYRVGGSNHTVSPYSYSGNFLVDHGASERHIFDPSNWDNSLTVIPTGTSGVPSSEFYLSQTESYCNDMFYREPFSEDAVREDARFRVIFKTK